MHKLFHELLIHYTRLNLNFACGGIAEVKLTHYRKEILS
jgi:hypothetical protein